MVLGVEGDKGGSDRGDLKGPARAVEAADLIDLESSLGHAIYWVGDRAGRKMTLARSAHGDLYLRYLPPEAEPGHAASGYLTVGTYPVAEAPAALRRAAAVGGGALERGPGGSALLASRSGESAYLAWPGGDLEVEIYDPRRGAALRVARSGAVRPVG